MLGRTWRAGGRRNVYDDFNDLTLQVTVGALFGTAIDRQQSRRVAGALLSAHPHSVPNGAMSISWAFRQGRSRRL